MSNESSRQPILGDHKEGLLFVMSAPAGTGKTTLIHKLTQEFSTVKMSISYTTRQPREGEVHGRDYFFITVPEFEAKINSSDFIEYVKLYDCYYGTSRQWLREQQQLGNHLFLVIDTQGARQLRGKVQAAYIFLKPPSISVLASRLIKRRTESQEMLQKRLDWASSEMKSAQEYDYQVINEDLETAYQVLRSILVAECHRTRSYKMEINNG